MTRTPTASESPAAGGSAFRARGLVLATGSLALLAGCTRAEVVVTPTVLTVGSVPSLGAWLGAIVCGALAMVFAGTTALLLVEAARNRAPREVLGCVAFAVACAVFVACVRALLETQSLEIHRDTRHFESARLLGGIETARRRWHYDDVRTISFLGSLGYGQMSITLKDGAVHDSIETLERPALLQVERALREDLGPAVVP